MLKLNIEKNLNKELTFENRKKFCIVKLYENESLKDHFTFNLDYLFTYVKEGHRKKFIKEILKHKGHNIEPEQNHLLECVKIYFS